VTLDTRLAALARAATASRELGLVEVADAGTEVLERARERAGFPGDAFVLALAGGTGVGKSSVLNALAGRTVSAVRALRPTTEEPIAWVSERTRAELAPLLAWLGVDHLAAHADASLERVAILDLPDVDSVRTEHRALVDRLLPRIDALAWIVDPEKYDDERLHGYLRSLAAHASRMRFVLNKADRVPEAERAALVADFERRLSESGIAAARIHLTSAASGLGIEALRDDLAAEANAKTLVVEKLAADVRQATVRMAEALAVAPDAPLTPLLDPSRRETAVREAVDGALAVVDLPGLARQVQSAVIGTARRRGGSLLARVVGVLAWMTGQQRRRADPVGYLRDWRRRGTLARAVNPIRSALLDAAARLPPTSRGPLLDAFGADDVEAASAASIDRAAREATADLRLPASVLWPVIGLLQLVAGAVFLFAVAWYVTLFVAGGSVPVSTIELPWLGKVPLPLVLLAGSFVVSAALGWIVAIHAGWLGRRASRRVEARVRTAVGDVVGSAGLAGLDRVEAARQVVASAVSVE
jgi:GTP-binding protein EngB required for normal cell division